MCWLCTVIQCLRGRVKKCSCQTPRLQDVSGEIMGLMGPQRKSTVKFADDACEDLPAGAQSNNSSNANMSLGKRCAEEEESEAVEEDHDTNRIICLEDTFGEEEHTRSRQPQVTANLGSPTKQEIEAT